MSIPADATRDRIVELARDLEFPAVLKPRGGYESREIHHVDGVETLLALLAPVDGDRVVPSEDFVLEEVLSGVNTEERRDFGDYVSVESAVVDGRVRHLAVTGKFPLEQPYRETGNFMPSLLSRDELRAVTELAGQALAAFGVRFGCAHTEIKLTAAGPRVIESNARVGGGGIEDLFVSSYGRSLLEIAVQAAIGIEPPDAIELRSDAVAYQLFVQPPVTARRLVRLDGLDEISALPGVEQLSPRHRAGDEVNWRQGSGGFVLSVRGSVADHDALRRMRTRILELLVVEYAEA